MAFPVAPGLEAIPGLGAPQSWEDRIREAAYTSPGGIRLRFDYEGVSREYTKRTAAFEFNGVNDSYVQQNGHSSRRYPMRCFFSGPDHDLRANTFEALLLEDGVGILEHPFYGTFDVVPFGDITRRDDLKDAANQTIIEVTFWTTLGAVYPQATAHPQSEILAAIGAFDDAAADQFASASDLTGAAGRAGMKATIRKLLQTVSAGLSAISDTVTAVNKEFRDIQSLVNYGMDVLIGQPLLLARQISNLIKAPGRALTGIGLRMDAYNALADDLFGTPAARPDVALSSGSALALRTTKIANDFHCSDLFALNYVAGAINAAIAQPIGEDGRASREAQFTTKPQALAAAERILDLFDRVTAWRDAGFGALSTIGGVDPAQVDTGAAYQALQQAVALTVGHLVEVSFTLVPERRIVLDRPRTIIDLCAELYGTVDDKLDFLIATNDLTGAEILELPRFKTIKYYPAQL
jgi:hypothetical protein